MAEQQTICGNCGETTEDNHLFNGICLRVSAEDLAPFEKTERGDWQGQQ